jgi:hypothetical protein
MNQFAVLYGESIHPSEELRSTRLKRRNSDTPGQIDNGAKTGGLNELEPIDRFRDEH